MSTICFSTSQSSGVFQLCTKKLLSWSLANNIVDLLQAVVLIVREGSSSVRVVRVSLKPGFVMVRMTVLMDRMNQPTVVSIQKLKIDKYVIVNVKSGADFSHFSQTILSYALKLYGPVMHSRFQASQISHKN